MAAIFQTAAIRVAAARLAERVRLNSDCSRARAFRLVRVEWRGSQLWFVLHDQFPGWKRLPENPDLRDELRQLRKAEFKARQLSLWEWRP